MLLQEWPVNKIKAKQDIRGTPLSFPNPPMEIFGRLLFKEDNKI